MLINLSRNMDLRIQVTGFLFVLVLSQKERFLNQGLLPPLIRCSLNSVFTVLLMAPRSHFPGTVFHILFIAPLTSVFVCSKSQFYFFYKSMTMSSECLCSFNNLSHNLLYLCQACGLLMS